MMLGGCFAKVPNKKEPRCAKLIIAIYAISVYRIAFDSIENIAHRVVEYGHFGIQEKND